ncbi:MAG: ribonuclease P protein component [Rhodospirillaceae bacterium]
MMISAEKHALTLSRLKKRGQFLRVARQGRKWAAPGLVLQARRRSAQDSETEAATRVGFTVTRQVGGAVVRNRARRRLKAAADSVLPRHARAGMDLVLIGRAGTLGRPFVALLADLETALRKVDAHRV